MKTYIVSILCILLSLRPAWGQPSISLEDFKKIDTEEERQKIIVQAPADEQNALREADDHLYLLSLYGGEAGLKLAKESRLAKQRGLGDLEEVFNEQADLGIRYVAYVYPGETWRIQQVKGRQFMNVQKWFAKRNAVVHALVAKLAASSQALALDGQAKQVLAEMQPAVFDGQTPPKVIKHVLDDVKRPLDELFKRLKRLPARSPDKVQQEYDEVQEMKLFGSISLEDFKKISSADERMNIIRLKTFARAPADEQYALREANEHLWYVGSFGEAGLKVMKESYLAKKRGLGDLEAVFNDQVALVSRYRSDVYSGAVPSVKTKRAQRVEEGRFMNEVKWFTERDLVVHALVAKLAASPQALALDGQAKQMRAKMGNSQPVNKSILDDVKRQLDALFKQLKQLPTMSPAEVQQEYDKLQDLELFVNGP